MRLEEFDALKGQLKQLCAALSKTYTDALGQAYWRVLRDVPLAEIEANVERILMTATRETKFPKPMELRTTPTAIAQACPANAEQLNQEVWREKFRADPVRAEIDLRYHQYQRILASAHAGSPEYAIAHTAVIRLLAQHGDPRFFRYA